MNDEIVRVLSIEDSPADATIVQEKLAKARRLGWNLPHFEVEHVERLEAARRRLEEGGIDVVLSDLDLPDSRADETVAALCRHVPDVPLVVLTGQEDPALAQKSVRAGVQDYLYKGEATGSLLARTMMHAIERQRSKQALQKARDTLERRVAERTAELSRANDVLRKNEALLDAMQRMAHVGGWAFDVETGKQTWTEETHRIHGIPTDHDPSLAEWLSFFPPEAQSTIKQAVERAVERGESYDLELPFVTAKGDHRWVHTMGRPTREDGKTVRVTGVIQDITERKRMEDALRESEERYRLLAETARDMICVHDLEGRIQYLNQAGFDFVGRPREEALGMNIAEFIHPRDLPAMKQRANQRLGGNGSRSLYEAELVDSQGQDVAVEISSSPIVREGEVTSVLLVVRDITERRLDEEAVRARLRIAEASATKASEELMRMTLDEIEVLTGSEIGFYHFVMDDQETLMLQTWSTNTLESLCSAERGNEHYPVSQAGVWVDCIRERAPVVHNDYASLAQRKGLPQGHTPVIRELVVPIIRGDRIVAVLGVGNKSVDYNEKDVEVAALLADFSWEVVERKRAEEEVERYAVELERSNEELEQFAYIVSHDLREPVRMVKGYLGLLERRYRGQLDEKADRFIDYAVEEAERMQEMILALLDLSRVDTRGEAPKSTDTGLLLERTLRSLERASEDAAADVTHGPLPTVMADEVQLAQVFQNLVANAIKFRREGVPPRIHIAAEEEGDEWVFSVADNGIGIGDPEQAERVFQVFQRLHTEEEYEGIGIGLALCKRVVERHGGRIWVESEIGEGATFYFTLPKGSQDSRAGG
jgi:PAS domain S-box-containing protein